MRIRWITILLVSLVAVSLFQTTPTVSAELPEYIDDGPFIDRIVYKNAGDLDERIMGLLSGEIEMDSTFLETYYLDRWISGTELSCLETLTEDPDIDIAKSLGNGYGMIAFHCDMFPTNISGFRRAFAYAFNKTKVTDDILNGYSQTHDSLVPYLNPFCIEDDLDWHYYDSRPDLGNAILDDLGFTVDLTTGFRKAPNGDSFSIMILYSYNEQCRMIAELAVEAFELLHVNADSSAPCNCDLHEQMVVSAEYFSDFDLSWLADDYSLEGHHNPWEFSTGFSNSTFDSWRAQLLYSSSYEDTFEAAAEMQKILHYNVPALVVQQIIKLQPYRTDRFERHIIDSMKSVSGPWTMLSIKPIDSTHGGTVTVGFENYPRFNFLKDGPFYGGNMLFNMHYSLYTRAPNQEPYPQLAETVSIETHSDNPTVPAGYTRFTFDIRDDVVWTDGIPVTIDDIIFTFNHVLEAPEFISSRIVDLTDLSALYAPIPNKFVIEFSTESYWLFNNFAYTYILPKHVFENFSPEDWEDWGLVTTAEGNSLNCGPFMLTDFEEGDWYELTSRDPYTEPDDEYGDGMYIPMISPCVDIHSIVPYFILHWELDWQFGETSNQGVTEDRFDMASPGYSSFTYTVFLDGEWYLSETWNQSTIIHSLDVTIFDAYLEPGQHNVTLLVEDTDHNIQEDTVIVTVILPSSAITFTIGLPLPIIAFVGWFYIGRFCERRRPIIAID